MGIQSLTKHILPYAEPVVLGENPPNEVAPPSVRSVVIDGPSLVYHVYYRLLAWKGRECDAIDPQPTCDQVSRGVATCLVHLANRGVRIHRIYFDGALPIFKRDIRLGRIEKSRQKLEFSRRQPLPQAPQEHRKTARMKPSQFWQSRHLPSRWKRLPENPFMVSGVFEDLKLRWSKDQIAAHIQKGAIELNGADYPWAAITVMVPGEADLDCAREAKLTGAAVLTNDSDLVVHDLGPHGAVVLLSSLYLLDNSSELSDSSDQDSSEIRGLRLSPRALCDRLGIQDLQRFAYELDRDCQLGLSNLVRRTKEELKTGEQFADFTRFLQEYRPSENNGQITPRSSELALDPRVSELFWQYELPGLYCWGDDHALPHIYLGILPEDPSRRCAWEQGRTYRALGYSLLNLSYPAAGRFVAVHEFVRRGGRIVSETVTLSEAKNVLSELEILGKRLALARSLFRVTTEPCFWVMFALSEIYQNPSNSTLFPTAPELEHFLNYGSAESQSTWTDIHLTAQIHAVLYSLRMLRQLLGAANEDLCKEHQALLSELPPLHVLLGSRQDMAQGFSNGDVSYQLVRRLFQHYG